MCIIVGQVEQISNTKIMAAVLNGGRQLTVYSNAVDTKAPVAMVLPFVGHNIEIIETKKDDMGVFNALKTYFHQPRSRMTNSFSLSVLPDGVSLPVYRSGNYRYSIAHSVADLLRLDPIFQMMGSDLIGLFSEYQKKNFGFVVCMIDRGSEYTPFAYVTDIAKESIFIPTKHYHQTPHSNGYEEIADDWDHEIYVLGCSESNAVESYKNNGRYSWSKYLPKEYPMENMFRIIRKGPYENADVILRVANSTCSIS